jgi:hypothetical protein
LNANKRTLIHVNCFQLSLTTGEEVEIEYEVDGWYYVSSHAELIFTRSFVANERILKWAIIFTCSGEEKEAWKRWKDGRSGSCSVCELMITAVCMFVDTCHPSCLEIMILRMAHKNGPM